MDTSPTGSQGPAPDAGIAGQGPKPGSKRSLIIIAAAVIGLAVLGWGCNLIVSNMIGAGVKSAMEAGTGVSVDERGGTVTIKGEDGATATFDETGSGTITFTDDTGKEVTIETQAEGDAKTLPKDFPSDFPIMGGMEVASTYSLASSEGTTTFTVEWSAAASVGQVAEFYGNALKESGWRVTVTATTEEGTYLAFERGPEDAPQRDGGWMNVGPDDQGRTRVSAYLVINAQ